MAAGYAAKVLCSCVFVGGRSEEDVRAQELSIYPFIWSESDTSKGVATASVLGMGKRTAIYVDEKRGCRLLALDEEIEAVRRDYVPMIQVNASLVDTLLRWGSAEEGWADIAYRKGVDIDKMNDALAWSFEPTEKGEDKGTRAVIVVYDSAIIGERYAGGFNAAMPQMGWSMTKSVTHALTGILNMQGKLELESPAPVSIWKGQSDERANITLDHLLQMRSGLAFQEIYVLPSHALRMLFQESNAGQYAASRKLKHAPGSHWKYSSGTTNIVSMMLRNHIQEAEYDDFPFTYLFEKIGMTSVSLEQDPGGTYVGSSFMFATPREWAKFGLLYLWEGEWFGERILPEGWAAYARTPSPPAERGYYGAHFWLNAGSDETGKERRWPSLPKDLYWASGFEGQYVFIFPSHHLVVVRLGFTPLRFRFNEEQFLSQILEALPR